MFGIHLIVTKRDVLSVSAVFLLLIIGISLSTIRRNYRDKRAFDELVTVYHKIDIGLTYEQAWNRLFRDRRERFQYISLPYIIPNADVAHSIIPNASKAHSRYVWTIKGPHTVSGKNWVLIIEFTNDMVTAVRFRKYDFESSVSPPAVAPPDKE